MLLLLISTFTMSIGTTNIMCIHWKMYPTCKEDYLTNCAKKRIDHCHKSRICHDPKMKRNFKGCRVPSPIHIKMDIRESS